MLFNESKLFARWQHRCGLLHSVLQQLALTSALYTVLTYLLYWRSMRSRVYATVCCLSVRLSRPAAAHCRCRCRFAAVGPAGSRYPLTDCSARQQQRANAGSATLSAYVDAERILGLQSAIAKLRYSETLSLTSAMIDFSYSGPSISQSIMYF